MELLARLGIMDFDDLHRRIEHLSTDDHNGDLDREGEQVLAALRAIVSAIEEHTRPGYVADYRWSRFIFDLASWAQDRWGDELPGPIYTNMVDWDMVGSQAVDDGEAMEAAINHPLVDGCLRWDEE
jgi:hypothetical protein